MNPYRKLLALLIFQILLSPHSTAQEMVIHSVKFQDQKVELDYSLTDSIAGRFYTVQLYTSHDQFLNPAKEVIGQIGSEITPGTTKKVIWDIKKELGSSYNGQISLELRARVYVPFIKIEGFEERVTLKRGKPYQINWSGGRPGNILNFELFDGEKKVLTYANIANVGTYAFTLPQSVKPGNDYRFKITDSRNQEETILTRHFKVKRRYPLMLKVVPAVALGVLFTNLIGKNSTPDNGIPDPPLVK